ncbi:MFS transporter [Aspergillus lucknowensis]|uniref:MFS transporter n=1 Tax=Aspergillus lucknowensis TaxID=176173 RepID=A0ABR4M0N4_9EURO
MNATHLAKASDVMQLVEQDLVPWYKKKNLRNLYFALVPAALGVEMTSGFDGSVLNGLQAVQSWLDYFDNPRGAILGIITAAFSLGAVGAIPAVPWVNDRFGRRASIKLGTVFILIGVVLQTASVNIAMFLVSRFILGAGIPFAINGASQLIAELAYPKERAVITGLFNESWYVGSILAAGVTLGTYQMSSTWAWRLPSLFQIIPSLLQAIFIWFVPESPRWLVSQDRSEEAFEILAKYHAEGNRDDPFVVAEFRQIRETIQLEKEASNFKWIDLFKSRANLHRLLIAASLGLFTQWSGNGLVSYYLAKVLATIGITDTTRQNQINLGLQCWNLVSGVSGAFVAKSLRRRWQYLIAFGGMTVVFACWTGASATFAQNGNHDAASAVVAMIFIYYGFYNLMHPMTYIYITEVFPFISRSKGVAILQFFSRAGSSFNQFVNPIGLGNLGWKFYLVYNVWLACETLVIFFGYPETKGPTLEELAIVFEGKKANVELVHVENKEGAAPETRHTETI